MQEMQVTLVWSLGWEDALEKEMATHSSILAWILEYSTDRGTWRAIVHGVTESQTQLSNWPVLNNYLCRSYFVLGTGVIMRITQTCYQELTFQLKRETEHVNKYMNFSFKMIIFYRENKNRGRACRVLRMGEERIIKRLLPWDGDVQPSSRRM